MRVAVAGGGGFIGSHLRESLEGSGHSVESFGEEGRGDGGDVDALVWLAGSASIREDADALRRCHVDDALRGVDACRPRHVVYVSSSEVYGRGRVPFSERDEPAPETAYGEAKLAGERALRARCERDGMTLTRVRPAVVYGPGQRGPMLIPAALRALREGERFPTTEGLQTRDFVHVRDVVALLGTCLEGRVPGLFNVGSGRETRVRDLLTMLAELVGPDAPGLLGFGERSPRAGEAKRYVLDIARARSELGWEPRVDLKAGLAGLVEADALRG